MVTLNAIFGILLVLTILFVVLAAGAIGMLQRIEKAIREDFEASLARAVTQTEIKVVPQKEKVVEPCICGHARADHWSQLEGGHRKADTFCHTTTSPTQICQCESFKPKRGLWPSDPPKI